MNGDEKHDDSRNGLDSIGCTTSVVSRLVRSLDNISTAIFDLLRKRFSQACFPFHLHTTLHHDTPHAYTHTTQHLMFSFPFSVFLRRQTDDLGHLLPTYLVFPSTRGDCVCIISTLFGLFRFTVSFVHLIPVLVL